MLLHDDNATVRAAACEATGEHELRLTLTEGKYHQVKRMVAAVGNRVDGARAQRLRADSHRRPGRRCLALGRRGGRFPDRALRRQSRPRGPRAYKAPGSTLTTSDVASNASYDVSVNGRDISNTLSGSCGSRLTGFAGGEPGSDVRAGAQRRHRLVQLEQVARLGQLALLGRQLGEHARVAGVELLLRLVHRGMDGELDRALVDPVQDAEHGQARSRCSRRW